MKQRKGLGLGQGKGYKNLVSRDPYVHSLSARGVKSINYINAVLPKAKAIIPESGAIIPFDLNTKKLKAMGNLRSYIIDGEYTVVVWAEDIRFDSGM